MTKCGVFLLIFFLSFSAHAQVAAVIEFLQDNITVYADHTGKLRVNENGEKIKKPYPKSEIFLPAAQLSNPSDFGLIMVEYRLKSDLDKRHIGWMLKGALKVDKLISIDLSPCAKNLSPKVFVRRSTRALGEGC